ncbi:hypothetical protein ACLOJK_000524 [Asimina triloba]
MAADSWLAADGSQSEDRFRPPASSRHSDAAPDFHHPATQDAPTNLTVFSSSCPASTHRICASANPPDIKPIATVEQDSGCHSRNLPYAAAPSRRSSNQIVRSSILAVRSAATSTAAKAANQPRQIRMP